MRFRSQFRNGSSFWAEAGAHAAKVRRIIRAKGSDDVAIGVDQTDRYEQKQNLK